MTFDATKNDLTTVARLISRLVATNTVGVTDTSNTAKLQAMVSQASNWFLTAINRRTLYVPDAPAVEVRNGAGQVTMFLRSRPPSGPDPDWVCNVTSLVIEQTTVPASVNRSAGYVVVDQSAISLIGYRFCRGSANISITYQAGFPAMVDPGAGDPPVLAPACFAMLSVEAAVLAICVAWWKRMAHADLASRSMGQGGGSVTFLTKDVPPEAERIIQQFTDVVPVL